MWGRFGFDWMLDGLLHVEVDQLASLKADQNK